MPCFNPAKMKILKFGGTSVGTVRSLTAVRDIVSAIRGRSIIIVSALGGVTDMLIDAAVKARDQIPFDNILDTIIMRHREVISEMVIDERRHNVENEVEQLLAQLQRLLTGVSLLAELTPRTKDIIVALGESMSSRIVAGMFHDAERLDSFEMVKTVSWADKDVADTELTSRLIVKKYAECEAKIVVAPGFISKDRETGRITNLGRGGSDYTAALIAAALNAESLEIWTDVDGFMTGDPRVITEATVIPSMSFVESMELCTYGAKVIYPPTIYPVFHKNIPIVIKNTFNPDAPGTLISDEKHVSKARFRGISSIPDTTLVTIDVLPVETEKYRSRLYNVLAKNAVGVIFNADVEEGKIAVALRKLEADNACRIIDEEFAPDRSEGKVSAAERIDGLATIALVGEALNTHNTVRPTVCGILSRLNSRTPVFARDTSPSILAFLIDEAPLHKTLNTLHDFFITTP